MKAFGHASLQCKENKQAQDQKCKEVESRGDKENKDSEGSREDVAYEVTESGFGSFDSADWVRVKKRRNGRKSRQQEESKIQEKTKTIKTDIQPVVSGGFHVHRQGIKQVWLQVRAQPVAHHLSTQSTGDVCCAMPLPIPASQASLLIKAIEGAG
ncbi:hypothetical protein U1Q18_032667 [Sarracenia purpurea var. burkii]